MPLGCLSDVSRKPLKCPLGEIRKQQNGQFTKPVMSPSTCGASRSQRKCICHVQLAETIRNRERFEGDAGKNIVQKEVSCSSLQPYNLTSLQPYIITFSFSTSPFRLFGLSQSSKQHPQKRSKVWRRRGFPFVERTKKKAWEVFSKSQIRSVWQQKASTLFLFW